MGNATWQRGHHDRQSSFRFRPQNDVEMTTRLFHVGAILSEAMMRSRGLGHRRVVKKIEAGGEAALARRIGGLLDHGLEDGLDEA